MDFMRLLKFVEELLYELVTWILFYPLTFWHSVRRPLKTMAYAEKELGDTEQEQYSDALSPPITSCQKRPLPRRPKMPAPRPCEPM